MREAAHNDFFVQLPGVGTFRYGRRNFADRLAIRREYLRMVQEFGDDDTDLSVFAALIATHEILCVEAPAGWENLALLDMTGGDGFDKALDLGAKIKEMEDSFHKGVDKSGAGESPAAGGDDRVSVPAPVQPAADGPEVLGADNRGDAG